MCLTLPETLVSVVGIEKILPTIEDLEVFLKLLPRSSTGERMNPYTSLWTGVTPGDGPQDLHVILLDNGRSRVLADPLGRAALRCIRCSACLNICPVYERVGGHAYGSMYPGPIGAILGPQLRGMEAPNDRALPFASTLCGACNEVCPVKIPFTDILVHLRHKVVEYKTGKHPTVEQGLMKGAGWVMADGKHLAKAQLASAPPGGCSRDDRWLGPMPVPLADAGCRPATSRRRRPRRSGSGGRRTAKEERSLMRRTRRGPAAASARPPRTSPRARSGARRPRRVDLRAAAGHRRRAGRLRREGRGLQGHGRAGARRRRSARPSSDALVTLGATSVGAAGRRPRRVGGGVAAAGVAVLADEPAADPRRAQRDRRRRDHQRGRHGRLRHHRAGPRRRGRAAGP